jgi:uncharacterized protein YyaL (SSP411 family)
MRLFFAVLGALLAAAPPAAAASGVPSAQPGAPAFPAEVRSALARALAAKPSDYVPRTRHREGAVPRYTNRLLLESSPYLQQHAHNPVNWYPWGDEAFEAARRLGRPVLVSIGYSTCHWCHVMEEESFDSVETARYLNEHFIAIKVDREARPDIDSIYMSAIHAMGQSGGWPLNVWVTPDRKPFFAGTYFPPVDRGRRLGFPSVLRSIHERYTGEPDGVAALAEKISASIAESLAGAVATSTQVPDEAALGRSAARFTRNIDRTWGGIGGRNKFPSTVPIRFLLRHHLRTGDPEALRLANLTLEKMAAGGVYDHVGGGFHRYATDVRWLVPHFEKMLYDNALLVVAYLEAGTVTGNTQYHDVARDVLRYVKREMTAPEGGFYSASDADSAMPNGEMEEGWYFTWTPAEIDAALDPPDAAAVKANFGVTGAGNFEGRTIFHTWRSPGEVAVELGISTAELARRLDRARGRLYLRRAERPAPLRDDKILAAWNGLMISAFARAGFVLAEPGYLATARSAANFVLERMRVDGRLARVYKDGTAGGPAFLEDYAFVIAGLIDLFEAGADPRWLNEALALQAVLDAHYADELGGGYFKTADDHEALLAREKPNRDGAIPSGNSVSALNLLRLAELTSEDAFRERAMLLLSAFDATMKESLTALPEMLIAVDFLLDGGKEIVLVGPESGGDLEAMLAPLRASFVPNRVLAVVREGDALAALAVTVPLVDGKRAIQGRVTAYVCENRVCKYPTSDPAELGRLIRGEGTKD